MATYWQEREKATKLREQFESLSNSFKQALPWMKSLREFNARVLGINRAFNLNKKKRKKESGIDEESGEGYPRA